MSNAFVELHPRRVVCFPVQNMDMDAPLSLDLLSRPQKAQRVGWSDPAALLNLQHDMARLPIKAPGTAVYVPEWMAPCEAMQKIVDYRHATSQRYEHEWMYLTYDRTLVQAGDYVRLNAGKHIDEHVGNLLDGKGRVSTAFLMVSSYGTVFYDGIKPCTKTELGRKLSQWQEMTQFTVEDIDPEELARSRNAYLDPLVYPAAGRKWPEGTIVCASGLTVHELQRAAHTHYRAFLHVGCYEDFSHEHKRERLRISNPPLARAVYGKACI